MLVASTPGPQPSSRKEPEGLPRCDFPLRTPKPPGLSAWSGPEPRRARPSWRGCPSPRRPQASGFAADSPSGRVDERRFLWANGLLAEATILPLLGVGLPPIFKKKYQQLEEQKTTDLAMFTSPRTYVSFSTRKPKVDGYFDPSRPIQHPVGTTT